MYLESSDLSDYLKSDPVVNCKDQIILEKAMALTTGLTTDVQKATRLFEWVRDEIPHTKDIQSDIVTCTATQVLKEGTGICIAKSHLLAALCRAIGIPTGFCYQKLKQDPPHKGYVLHGLNGIYLESIKKWIRVDARGNTGEIDAQFSTKKEQLAFPTNEADGEILYQKIFKDPVAAYVDILNRHDNRTKMWPNLPIELIGED
ncbi:transglutaminase domain-containing protein [bacterium]|jgi:transglutaminase-like putative cysteine protease|nr:transglutaminase domain-containing protein [bacterium]